MLSTLMHLMNASGYAFFTISWSSINAFVYRVVGLRFKSWAGHLVNRAQCCQWLATTATFLLKEVALLGRNDVEMGPAYLLHTSSITASIIKKLI